MNKRQRKKRENKLIEYINNNRGIINESFFNLTLPISDYENLVIVRNEEMNRYEIVRDTSQLMHRKNWGRSTRRK